VGLTTNATVVYAHECMASRFLLPALQIQAVLDQTTISKRRKALLTIPVGLESAFEITINRIRSQNSQRAEQAMNVLMWTLQGKRNLTISEFFITTRAFGYDYRG
jgi:hypothetical protein